MIIRKIPNYEGRDDDELDNDDIHSEQSQVMGD